MQDVNLLVDKIVPIRRKGGLEDMLDLPEVLEALSKDDIESFQDIKFHQSSAIDLFFAHLAVLCIDIVDDGFGILATADVWRSRLVEIAAPEHWMLYSSDPSISTFMQPGMSRAEFDKTVGTKGKIFSPDEIGVLIVSKNHTVKFSAMPEPTAWNWVVSLIETQTLSGFDGRSLYGIPRMNGGTSTRFKVATYTDLSASGKWNSDVAKVLRLLPEIYRDNPHFDEDGPRLGLPWTLPWDGEEQIKTTELHPLYIDVSRRIKLGKEADGRLFVVTSGSSNTRVPNLDLKGNFGDPWAPRVNAAFNEKAKKAVEPVYTSLSPSSIPIQLLAKIVLGNQDIRQSPLQSFAKSDIGKDAFFCLSAILRGQGETYGYQNFVIPIPAKTTFRLAAVEEIDKVGERSKSMLAAARNASAALKFGVYRFCQPGDGEIDFKNNDKSHALNAKVSERFTQAFTAAFFPFLWQIAESGDETHWQAFLKDSATSILEEAFRSGGSRTQLSFKAEAAGRSAFQSRWYNLFNKEDTK